MNNEENLLCNLPVGSKAIVAKIQDSANRRRFLDLGLTEGTVVVPLYKSPSQNPVAYKIRGATVALRNEDAAGIIVKKMESCKIK